MSAPVINAIATKLTTPIIAIIIAPKKALPKPFTSKPGTNAAASIIISALMTRANKPKVNTDNGAVKNQSSGRIDVFIRPSMAAAIRNVKIFLALMPGISSVAKPRPATVANQAISKAAIAKLC